MCIRDSYVSAHGSRQRSAGAARYFRRAEYFIVLSVWRHLSCGGISCLAALDFLHRSVHVCGARAEGAAPEKHGILRHLFGYSYLVRIFHCAGQPVRCFLQEADLGCEREKRLWDCSMLARKNQNRKPCAMSSAE